MNIHRFSRHLTWFGLAVLFVLSLSAGQSQCAKVEDSATAPELTPGNGSNSGYVACIHACNDAAKVSRENERKLHKQNVRDCHGDTECLQEEAARHAAAMAQIAQDEQDCKKACHDQGDGDGGQ
jgi:hypothetical protein